MDSKVNRSPRKEFQRHVEFIFDEDIIDAKSVNISDTGIRFDTEEPIVVLMRMHNDDGTTQDKKAELVWVRGNEEGGQSYGLRYLSKDKQIKSDELKLPDRG